jgi:predicted patatin/cPLA2 family phospholipase
MLVGRLWAWLGKKAAPAPAVKPSAMELIKARMAGKRNDPWKLAIVVEDGSMRWVVAAGMLSLLEQYGIDADLMLGNSGGGLALAYYAAGQTREGSLCLRYLNRLGFERDGDSRRFIDAGRLWRSEPVMDINGMVDVVFSRKIPLDWDSLRASAAPVYMLAMDRAGETVMQPLHGVDKAEQKTALKNTARIPWVAHDPADETVLWDGGMAGGLPVRQALDMGATHVLVIRCNGANDGRGEKLQWLERYVIWPVLWWKSRIHYAQVRARHDKHFDILAWLKKAGDDVLVLAMPQVEIGGTEDDEGRLFRQLVDAYRYAAGALGLAEPSLPHAWVEEAEAYL